MELNILKKTQNIFRPKSVLEFYPRFLILLETRSRILGLQELFVLRRSVKEGEEGQGLFQVMLQGHSWESDPVNHGV
jgi:hypothetical protein